MSGVWKWTTEVFTMKQIQKPPKMSRRTFLVQALGGTVFFGTVVYACYKAHWSPTVTIVLAVSGWVGLSLLTAGSRLQRTERLRWADDVLKGDGVLLSRHCGHCGFDFAEIDRAMVCPECHETTKREL